MCGLGPQARPPVPHLSAAHPAMAEYGTLLQDLTDNITLEDLEQLKSACKEDIPSEKSEEITTGSAWFRFLESHNKLDKGARAGPAARSPSARTRGLRTPDTHVGARALPHAAPRRARAGSPPLTNHVGTQGPWSSQSACPLSVHNVLEVGSR